MSDKELKLIVAGQCLAGILANSACNSNATNEQLAKSAWDVTTELMALKKKEDDEEIARIEADFHRRLEEKK